MKVLFITQYFPPEIGAPQARIYELCIRLARMGHDVSVLTTFPNYPSGIVPKEWQHRLFHRTIEQSVQIIRVRTYTVPNRGFLRRIISHLSFALNACLAAPWVPSADVLIVESPPLFSGIAGMVLGRLSAVPFVFSVADLWPETAVQMGMLRNPVIVWLSRRLELLTYRRAATVLAVTEGIQKKIISDGISPAKVMLFRNAVDAEFFRPECHDSTMRRVI